jgi:hypothetical protein
MAWTATTLPVTELGDGLNKKVYVKGTNAENERVEEKAERHTKSSLRKFSNIIYAYT